MELYARVAVDVKHPDIKREYTYSIPEKHTSKIRIGDLVKVPFANTKIEGIVMEISSEHPVGDYRIRSIIKRETAGVSEDMVKLSEHLADYYGASAIDFLKLMLPPKGFAKREVVYRLTPGSHVLSSRAHVQARVIEALKIKDASTSEISKRICANPSSVSSALRALIKKGFVMRGNRIIRRKPDALKDCGAFEPQFLTEEQKAAVKAIRMGFGRRRTMLLFGVTGSGKTEVYIKAMELAMRVGKSSILLVPEISLTPQIVAIFQSRFPGKVAVIHSRLSPGERFDEWNRIKTGEATIVIGPRSAIFAPVQNIGIIIVDEEHESSYKQMVFPFYDARTIAKMRSDQHDSLLLLGSATPSVDTYHNALNGSCELVKLTKRVSDKPLPYMEIVDMTQEMREGHRLIFSRRLLSELRGTLLRGEQAILFLNRRGHSTFVICRECGYILKCPHCDISLTYHSDEETGKCHYCGFTTRAPSICPNCRGKSIRYFGAGTEKIEQEITRVFPGVTTLRVDSDTTSRKGSLERMLKTFGEGKAQILVGTQVVAKGLDFPKVTLVGIVSADTALNMPDFRAGERTFQLITQVAGRAGRGEVPGKVYIQTYTPEAVAIKAACEKGLLDFYHYELAMRQKSNYPPYSQIINITCSGPNEDASRLEAQRVFSQIKAQDFGVEMLGPAPAPRPKIRGHYRYSILGKGGTAKSVNEIARFLRNLKRDPEVNVSWDVDPQDLM